MGRFFYFRRGGVKVLLKISRDIKRLNKDFDSIDVEEMKTKLIKIENKIRKLLVSKGFLPVKDLVEKLLEKVGKLKNNLGYYDKTVQKQKVEEIWHDIEEIIDQQMFSEIGGAGEYLRNMREAEDK